MIKMEDIIVEINALGKGGHGYGKYYDRDVEYEYSVFVPYTVPGDKVKVKVVEDKGRVLICELKEIIYPSTARKEPKCPHFMECGACNWLHIDYKNQLTYKQKIVEHVLKRKVDEILPSSQYNYRIRSRFKGDIVNGKVVLGFHKEKKNKIVEINECLLVHPMVNKTLKMLRKHFSKTMEQLFKFEVEIHAKELTPSVMILFKVPKKAREYMWEIANEILGEHYVRGVMVTDGEVTKASDKIHSAFTINSPKTVEFRYRMGSFTQVNLEQNKAMVEVVYTLAGKGKRLLDLYCGIGNFSLALNDRFEKVVGVELNMNAIKDANINKMLNKADNCEFICSSADGFLERKEKFDVIVTDPPREGLGDVAEKIHLFDADRIVYISCNPDSLSKDLEKIKGYTVKRIQPLDMFPNTPHVETVVLLEK